MATFSIKDLKEWYNEFNARYFNNELTRCEIILSKTKRALGQFCVDNSYWTPKQTIKISVYLDRPIKEVQNTLIHEMIHQWQYEEFGKSDHGKTFKDKAMEINKDGWNIARCNSTEGCVANNINPNKVYNVCIFKKDGRYGKAVIASTNVDTFKKWMPLIKGISEIYFGYSKDKNLGNYTCSRKKLTWKWIEENEFNFLTTKLTPLVRKVA
mgnify:CR=1 FL=1